MELIERQYVLSISTSNLLLREYDTFHILLIYVIFFIIIKGNHSIKLIERSQTQTSARLRKTLRLTFCLI
jgi:hypothetical protein